QPALSRQINALEDELGVKLFERIRRRLVLTPAGEQLLAECRTVLGAVHSLSERAQVLRRTDYGVVRVAATPQSVEGVVSTRSKQGSALRLKVGKDQKLSNEAKSVRSSKREELLSSSMWSQTRLPTAFRRIRRAVDGQGPARTSH